LFGDPGNSATGEGKPLVLQEVDLEKLEKYATMRTRRMSVNPNQGRPSAINLEMI
jgi:hypothetical protein